MQKDIIVLLPGIMGSALKKNGKTLWDVSLGAGMRALTSAGGSIKELMPSGDSANGDGVQASHLLADAHLIPFLWKIDGYSAFSKYVQSVFKSTPGEDFVEFPYDWRLDNRVSAAHLKEAADGWLEARRSKYGSDVRLIFIAHSMGGLVARYYIEKLGGWKDTRWLITLGTPHRGSVKALDFLVNGMRKKVGPITLFDLSEFVRACPSVYQLLPIYPCVGTSEDDLQRLEDLAEHEGEIGGLNLEKARDGIAFHREIAQAAEGNKSSDSYQKANFRLVPVVGTYQPTYQSALRTKDGVEPIYTYKHQDMLGGDGTVPRLSATPIELSGDGDEMFASCPHAGLQNFVPVRVHVRAALQDVDISNIMAAAPEPLILDLEDLYSTSEPFEARARCDAVFDPMEAELEQLETGTKSAHTFEMEHDDDEWQRLRLPPLESGTYRLRIDAGADVEPITDVFAVA